MSFADVSFTKAEADFDALFNEPGYVVDGAQGSRRSVYRPASMWCESGRTFRRSGFIIESGQPTAVGSFHFALKNKGFVL